MTNNLGGQLQLLVGSVVVGRGLSVLYHSKKKKRSFSLRCAKNGSQKGKREREAQLKIYFKSRHTDHIFPSVVKKYRFFVKEKKFIICGWEVNVCADIIELVL